MDVVDELSRETGVQKWVPLWSLPHPPATNPLGSRWSRGGDPVLALTPSPPRHCRIPASRARGGGVGARCRPSFDSSPRCPPCPASESTASQSVTRWHAKPPSTPSATPWSDRRTSVAPPRPPLSLVP